MHRFNQLIFNLLLLSVAWSVGCTTTASSRYFGKTEPPRDNILRYVSGPEVETLDPQVSSGQPESRVYMALFDGLVEYDPKTMQPIPSLAERWEIAPNVDEFIFYLRKNGRWSNGDPITAGDFVYSLRRGFRPDVLSRTANLGYYIKYAKAVHSSNVFVKKNNEFLLAKDFAKDAQTTEQPPSETVSLGRETEFHKFIRSPERLVLEGDLKQRAKQLEADPKLKAAVEGAEFVPVKGEDIGIEAIDDYTLRISLSQPAPFFLGMLAHSFFRLVPEKAIEKYGRIDWTKPDNIITCGPFKLKTHQPYHLLEVEKDPNFWDAANVRLAGIKFYPSDEQTTILNLYKAGEIDAMNNHAVLASWIDEIRKYKDEYLDFPEIVISYYIFNVNKAPVNNVKVRQALSRAIDRDALAKFRKIVRPLYAFSPEGAFPDYETARERVGEQLRQERGMSREEWENRDKLNPKAACKLMAEAGYKITPTDGERCKVEDFPVDKVSFTYPTAESNKIIAEFIQAQWKQNLGLTIPLKNMEFKTFLTYRSSLEYDGIVQGIWGGDYVDPFTFLNLHYGEDNEGSTGWHDPKYDALLDEANRTPDPNKRYELMAQAEYLMLDQQIVIPLTTQATDWMKKPYVKGMYPNPGGLYAWKFVYIEPDPAKWDTDVENIMK